MALGTRTLALMPLAIFLALASVSNAQLVDKFVIPDTAVVQVMRQDQWLLCQSSGVTVSITAMRPLTVSTVTFTFKVIDESSLNILSVDQRTVALNRALAPNEEAQATASSMYCPRAVIEPLVLLELSIKTNVTTITLTYFIARVLPSRIEKMLSELSELRSRVDESRGRLDSLMAELEQLRRDKALVEGRYNELRERFEELSNKYRELSNSYSNVQARFLDLNREFESLSRSYQALLTNNTWALAELGRWRSMYQQLKAAYDDLSTQFGGLRNRYESLSSSFSELSNKYSELSNNFTLALILSIASVGTLASLLAYTMLRRRGASPRTVSEGSQASGSTDPPNPPNNHPVSKRFAAS